HEGEVGLGVEVHEQDPQVPLRERVPQRERRRGLAHPALLIGDGDDGAGGRQQRDLRPPPRPCRRSPSGGRPPAAGRGGPAPPRNARTPSCTCPGPGSWSAAPWGTRTSP